MQLWRYTSLVPAQKKPSNASRPRVEKAGSTPAAIDIKALGSMLASRRKDASLSVRQAADDAGVSFSTVTRVEGGSQPDLATFMKLCAWLRVRPEQFFLTGGRRDESTIDSVVHHLYADPDLDPAAAESIASVVRDLYAALAKPQPDRPLVACHLRAAPVMRAGVPEMLSDILTDLRDAVEQRVRDGVL